MRIVHGVGLHGLQAAREPLDCGNAGTAMRLLTGLLAGQAFDSTLVGDASLSQRPMRRVIDPLAAMGASIESNGWPRAACGSEVANGCTARTSTWRLRAPSSSPRCCWRACTRMAKPASPSRIRPAITPNACSPHSASTANSRRASPRLRGWCRAARYRRHRAGGLFVGGVFPGRGDAGAGFRIAAASGRHESAPDRLAACPADDGCGHRRRGRERARWRAGLRSARPACGVARHRGAGRACPGHDRRVPDPVRGRGLRATARPWCAAPPNCGSRNPTASR